MRWSKMKSRQSALIPNNSHSTILIIQNDNHSVNDDRDRLPTLYTTIVILLIMT